MRINGCQLTTKTRQTRAKPIHHACYLLDVIQQARLGALEARTLLEKEEKAGPEAQWRSPALGGVSLSGSHPHIWLPTDRAALQLELILGPPSRVV